jgi:stage III sporulation protein AA
MLRDIVRQLSDSGVRVCVVDERCEIAAMRGGRTGFDLGGSTSVLSGAPKAAGMIMMLRAMSPDVIVTDEIGTGADAKAVSKIINSGTRLITSIHGSSLEQVRRRKDIRQAIDSFEVYITLSKSSGAGTVEEIIT